MAGRYIKPVRFRFTGDIDACQREINYARTKYAELVEDRKFIDNGYKIRNLHRADGFDFRFISSDVIDIIEISAPAGGKKEKKVDYFPYFWAGCRIIEGGYVDPSSGLWENTPEPIPPNFGNRVADNTYKTAIEGFFLCDPVMWIWEPGAEEITNERTGTEPQIVGSWDWAGTEMIASEHPDSVWPFKGHRLNWFTFHSTTFPEAIISTDKEFWYSNNGMVATAFTMPWDPDYGNDNTDDAPYDYETAEESWAHILYLNPSDPEKTWAYYFPYYGPRGIVYAINKQPLRFNAPIGERPQLTWQIPGTVLPGKYALKVMAARYFCERPMLPMKIEVEIRLGQPDGIFRKRFVIELADGSGYYRDASPFGLGSFLDPSVIPDDPFDENPYGPNPHNPLVWQQGAFLIDIQGGTITLDEKDVPNYEGLITEIVEGDADYPYAPFPFVVNSERTAEVCGTCTGPPVPVTGNGSDLLDRIAKEGTLNEAEGIEAILLCDPWTTSIGVFQIVTPESEFYGYMMQGAPLHGGILGWDYSIDTFENNPQGGIYQVLGYYRTFRDEVLIMVEPKG